MVLFEKAMPSDHHRVAGSTALVELLAERTRLRIRYRYRLRLCALHARFWFAVEFFEDWLAQLCDDLVVALWLFRQEFDFEPSKLSLDQMQPGALQTRTV